MCIAKVLVGPSNQLKKIIQIEHNIVKNLNWQEANQLAIIIIKIIIKAYTALIQTVLSALQYIN